MKTPLNCLKSIAIASESAQFDGVVLRGYPSVTGVIDSYGDVIFPGAFQGKCLPDFLKRGFNTTDHVWSWTALVGYPTMAEERGNKLYSEFTFHSDPNSQAARVKCQERIAAGKDVGLSIGFSMLPSQYLYFGNGRELLDFAKKRGYDLNLFDTTTLKAWNDPCQAILGVDELFEYSLTPSPANREAIALQAKSASAHYNKRVDVSARGGDIRVTNMKKLNTICGSLSLPIAAHIAKYNAKDAIERIKAFTGATNEPNAEFAKAFIAVDGDNEEFDSFKLPFVDIIDGKMQVSMPALKAAASWLNGERAGDALPDEAMEGAKRFVEAYYAKAAAQFDDGRDAITVPWANEANGGKFKGQFLGDYVEMDMTMSAMYEGFYSLYYACADCLAGYGDYAGMSKSERMACLGGMFDEYKTLCMGICEAIASGDAAEDGEAAAKTARKLTTSQLANLGDGLPYSKHARITVDATALFIERTTDRCNMRRASTPSRELSATDLRTIAEHRDNTAKSLEQLDELIKLTEPRDTAHKAREERMKAIRLELAQRDMEQRTVG